MRLPVLKVNYVEMVSTSFATSTMCEEYHKLPDHEKHVEVMTCLSQSSRFNLIDSEECT